MRIKQPRLRVAPGGIGGQSTDLGNVGTSWRGVRGAKAKSKSQLGDGHVVLWVTCDRHYPSTATALCMHLRLLGFFDSPAVSTPSAVAASVNATVK